MFIRGSPSTSCPAAATSPPQPQTLYPREALTACSSQRGRGAPPGTRAHAAAPVPGGTVNAAGIHLPNASPFANGTAAPTSPMLRISSLSSCIQLMYHVSGHSLGARTGCLGLIPHKSPASAIPKRGIEPTPASRPAQLPLHAHAPVPARTSLHGLLLHWCCSQQG